ncbi:hypothetical protein L873DRAFT_1733951 [Choiromyces venosus 120613-1]|uniref:Uncharacterized protein n=1 Tax=Choiromyces venosus 120613-1 TaxID=1336337 RepID=A0A3N4JUG6_9PEZI|nr:hypothetical protein L873DRAFT_1733951 [Choiromyces venosus 120613-1]
MSLYGAPRPKSKPKPIPLSQSSIHALATELSLARTRPRQSRARPSEKPPSNRGVAARAARDEAGQTTNRDIGGDVDERQLVRSRKKLVIKAGVYERLRRGGGGGEGEGEDGLVDFDKKWVEEGEPEFRSSDDEEEEEEEEEGGEMVEHTDDLGRTRKVSEKALERILRREARAKLQSQDQESTTSSQSLAAQPLPEAISYGPRIQTGAFQTANFSSVPTADMLAAAMPVEKEGVEEVHYDAGGEVRTKGVGFYQFSKDEGERKREFAELEEERRRTEMERERMAEKKRKRKEDLEKRKEEVRKKRRVKVGGSWLEGFMGELEGGKGGTAEEADK